LFDSLSFPAARKRQTTAVGRLIYDATVVGYRNILRNDHVSRRADQFCSISNETRQSGSVGLIFDYVQVIDWGDAAAHQALKIKIS